MTAVFFCKGTREWFASLLEYLIGGITELGGVGTEQLLKKLEVIDNSLLRISAKLAVKTGSEVFEEDLQNYLEPAIRSIIFGEEYDAPTIEERLETAVTTALSTLMLEGSSTVADDLSAHNAPFAAVSSYPAGHTSAVDTEFQKYYDRIIKLEGDLYGAEQAADIFATERRVAGVSAESSAAQGETSDRSGVQAKLGEEKPGVRKDRTLERFGERCLGNNKFCRKCGAEIEEV